jgi:peptide/nickel transport system substrate-binding protein
LKHYLLLVFLLILFMFGVVAQMTPVAAISPATTSLRMTLVVAPTSINPNTITTGSSSGVLIGFEYWGSPIALPNGSLDTSQAITDWISHNSNYTVWTFNVKPGLKWSNGTAVTANDILTTFGPNFGFNATYDYLGMGSEVKSESALNSSAAVFDLNVSDAHWPDKFNWDLYTPVFPSSFIHQQGAAGSNLGTDIVAGPFYVSNYQAGQTQMVMLRNPYFYTTGLKEPEITQINVNFVESLSLTAGLLQSGSTDLAPVEPSNAQSVLKNPNIHILDEKGLYISDLQYNDTVYPYNMTAFRQALVYGINQTAYIDSAFNGYAVPAYNAEGVLSPLSSQWYNSNQQTYSFNPGQATSLLNSIGIKKGSDGHLQYPNGTDVTIHLWADTDNTADAVGAGVVQSDLQNLGFVVNLQTTSVSNIIGYYNSNLNGIRDGIILSSTDPPVWGNPYLDALPGWDVYWLATVPNIHWEYPAGADSEYQSNYSAFLSTADPTLEHQYLDNIQALNSANLPTIVLAYPDALWGYNTQYWTNWPSGYIQFGASILNATAFANLQPASASSSTTSTTPTSPGLNYVYLAIGVVVVVIIASIVAFTLRRRTR